jgi:hypothetical protein
MAENLVSLCVFHDYLDAREAANRLNAAGIPTTFLGEANSAAGLGFAPTVLTLELLVPESCLERACSLLALDEPAAEDQESVSPDGVEEEEEGEDKEEPRGIVKEILGGAVGAFLDGPLASLNRASPSGEPDATPPRTVWAVLLFLLFLLTLVLGLLGSVLN